MKQIFIDGLLYFELYVIQPLDHERKSSHFVKVEIEPVLPNPI